MASFQFYFGNKSSDLLNRHALGTHWFPHFDKEDRTEVSVHLDQDDKLLVNTYQRENGGQFFVIEVNERTSTGAYRQFKLFTDRDGLGSLKALHAVIGETIAKIESANGGE